MDEGLTGRENQDQTNGESSGGAESMGSWLDEHEQAYRQWRRGDVVDGVVVSTDRDEFLVDIGSKSEAIVPAGEIPHNEEPSVGETVLAYVLSSEDQEGRVVLSLTRARAERGWRNLQKQFEEGKSVEGEVAEFNKGGLVVTVEGVRGFVPLSQIADLRRGGPDESVESRLEVMRGRTLLLKVIEMNRRRNRLILSERAALQERRSREKERLLEELQPGETREGNVSSICDFGAFVDLGGADGLVHLSELSWGQVTHPSQVVKVGDRLKVYVVGVDRENKKIALSLKRLQGEPWTRVTEKYQQGQVVVGKITKLAAFGAFAEIEPGIEGLIHISELSEDRITHPKQVVREGDELPLKIIRIEPDRHRLGLSLRQAEEEAPYGMDDGAYTTQSADYDVNGGSASSNDAALQAASSAVADATERVSSGALATAESGGLTDNGETDVSSVAADQLPPMETEVGTMDAPTDAYDAATGTPIAPMEEDRSADNERSNGETPRPATAVEG